MTQQNEIISSIYKAALKYEEYDELTSKPSSELEVAILLLDNYPSLNILEFVRDAEFALKGLLVDDESKLLALSTILRIGRYLKSMIHDKLAGEAIEAKSTLCLIDLQEYVLENKDFLIRSSQITFTNYSEELARFNEEKDFANYACSQAESALTSFIGENSND